jgi:hypothetical protein
MAQTAADKKRTADAARRANAKIGRGFQRRPIPRDYWRSPGEPLRLGRENFQVWWVPRVGEMVNVDANVEQVTWEDASPVLSGTVTFRDPFIGKLSNIGLGDQFVLKWSAQGGPPFVELWRMRVNQPFRSFLGGNRTLQVTSDLWFLQASTDDFHFRKTGATGPHPHGWLASEIAQSILERYGMPVGVLTATRHRILNLTRVNTGSSTKITPLDTLTAAYARERNYTNKRYVISCFNGKVNITPLRHSKELLLFGEELVEATIQQTLRDDFATSLTVRAQGKTIKVKDKKGHSKQTVGKISVLVQSEAAIRRYGFVHRVVWAHDARTVAEARSRGQYHLSVIGQPTTEVNVTSPGVAMIRRGDACRIRLDDPVLHQVVFVTDASHSLTAGSYQVALQFMFSDPFVDAKLDTVDEDLAEKQKARTGKTTKKSKTPPLPKQNVARAPAKTPGQRLAGRGHPS